MAAKFNAKRFRHERLKQKLSQAHIAEQADTTVRYIRDLEKGRKVNPSAAIVFQFSNVLSIPMEELMHMEEGDE